MSKGLPAFFIARMEEGAGLRAGVKDGMLPVFDEGNNLFYFATSLVMRAIAIGVRFLQGLNPSLLRWLPRKDPFRLRS